MLTPGVRATIEAHGANCPDCREAYVAAIAAQELIGARAAQVIEPSPFFATRVMAVIRERGARRELTMAGLAATNNALRAALSAMILLVMLLFAVTLYFGGREVGELEQPTESALLDEGDAGDDLSDLQVMSILYEPQESDEYGK
jgi:predicted anti-sigma-YlaC factor YlaD